MLVLSLVVSLLIQGCFVQHERQDLWINVKYFSLREFGHYFQENGLFFIKKRNDALIDLCIRKRVTYGSLSIRSPNKYAKITYGNKTSSGRGIKNLHLNIRSIRNKMSDIKHLIHKEKPHLFGLSESEWRRILMKGN